MPDTIGEAFVAIRPDLSNLDSEITADVSNITAELNVGVNADQLQLDLTSAVEGVPPLDVAANTDEATAAVDALVGEASTEATLGVGADVGSAQDAIDGVIQSASDQVNIAVNADTTLASDEIDTLISSAEGEGITIPVNAGGVGGDSAEAGAGLETLNKGIETLHGSSEILAGSAAGLTSVLSHLGPEAAVAAGGVAAITAGTKELFEAGLDAVSAEERFNRLLGEQGEAIRNVNVGSLRTDLFDLGTEFGSTKAEVQNTATTLFEFAKNAGASGEESSHFVDQIAALSARAISLNPQLGTMSDVAGTLGIRLARGGRFASSFGVSLTASEINARALADTGKETASSLTLYEKAAAAATLATEKYGSTIGEDVEAGSKNAAVQVSALKAEFHDAIEEIGKPLVAPIIQVLHDAIGPGEDVGRIFADLARITLPLLAGGLHAIEGPLDVVANIFDAVATPLGVVADLIDKIPGPIRDGAGAAAAFGLAAAFLPGLLEAVGFAALNATIALTEFTVALAVEQPELLAIGAAVGIAVAAWGFFNDQAPDNTAAVEAITQALNDQNDVLDTSTQNVGAYLAVADTIGKDPDHVKALNELNVQFSDLADLSNHGAAGLSTLIDHTLALGKATDVTNKQQSELENVIDVNGRQYQVMDDNIRHTIVAYKDQIDAAEKAAETQSRSAVETKAVTKAQLDAAISAHTVAGKQTDWVGVLNDLKPSLDAAGQAAASQTDEQKKAADAAVQAATATAEQQQTLQDVLASTPGVRLAYDGITNSVTGTKEGFLGLAEQITDDRLSKDQIEAIAVGLGTTADQLTSFVDGVKQALDEMTNEATSKLPTTEGAIDSIVQFIGKVPEALNPKNVIDAIKANLTAITDFQSNLDFLLMSGLPHLAQLALKEGPEITASLVEGIKKGGPDVGKSLEGMQTFADAGAANLAQHVHDVIAPQLALQTGLIGKLMTDSFGATFQIEAPTQAQLDQARLVAELSNVPLADALRTVAGAGAVAYEQALGVMPGTTQGTVDGVKTTIDGSQNQTKVAGQALGDAASQGFGTGIDGIRPQTTSVPASIYEALTNADATNTVKLATNVLAVDLVAGLVSGLDADSSHKATNDAMKRLIDSMLTAGREEADSHSPSRKMAQLGSDLGAGLVIGIDSSTDDVSKAMTRLVTAASVPARKAVHHVGTNGVYHTGADVTDGHAGAAYGGNVDNSITAIIEKVVTPDPMLSAVVIGRTLRGTRHRLSGRPS